MAIVVLKRPYDKNWSGNPVHYHLYSGTALVDPTIYFEIKIYFKRTDEAVYTDVYTAPYNPVNGSAKFDIQVVLHGLMEYETPSMPADSEYTSPLFTKKMTGHFYIAWREIAADPDPAWVTTESANAKFVIKGGISFHKWRGDNYWTNYFEPLRPFLTWQQTGRLAGLEERMYLAWLNLTTVSVANIKMRRKVVYVDGTNYTADLYCPATQYEVVFFPCGAQQLKLEQINPGKKIYYWELQVWDTNDNIPLSELFTYEADNTKYYDVITLNYRNSLGGLDSARVRGLIEYSVTREFTLTEQIVQHDYFTGNFVNGKVKASDSTELLVYKGDIGHLKKEELDRLRDIHFQREVWWEQQKKWMPVITMTGSQKLKTSNDQMWSLAIEFSIASGGENYYTPNSINLAEAAAPLVPVCTAVISPLTLVEEVGGHRINWSLVSGAPNKYFVSTPGVSGGAPSETIATTFLFPWLPVGENLIKVQPLCLIGTEFYFGTPQFITVTVAPACMPVAISGGSSLPDGIAGTAYSHTITLSGTPPHTLSNVIKPSWMIITPPAPGGNTIEISGTPTSSGSFSLSLTVTNCGGPFVNFADSFSIASAGFRVQNDRPGASINAITPAIYTFISGAFPIAAGTARDGSHTGTIDSIELTVHITGTAHLSLYRNGIHEETINVSGTGLYAFDAIPLLSTDAILILLTP